MAFSDDDEFIYQARRPGRQVDPAVRRIVLGAGGASALVIVVAMLWSGVRGVGFGPPPVIAPPPGPLRVVPADPGGLSVPEANVPIMSGDTAAAAPQLAPAAPVPDVSAFNQAAGITPPPAPAPPPVAAAPPPALPSGPAQVQLASTADEAGAEAAWTALQAKYPKFFAGKTPEILPDVVSGQSFWRVRLGGFASGADAQSFCALVMAQGASCTVAAF